MLNNLRRSGCSGVDESSEVRRLNTGIKTDELNAPKAQIMSSRALQDNFDDAVGLHQDFIAQTKPTYDNDKCDVSGFEGGGSGAGGGSGRGRCGGRSGDRKGRGAEEAVEETEAAEEITRESKAVMSRTDTALSKNMPS